MPTQPPLIIAVDPDKDTTALCWGFGVVGSPMGAGILHGDLSPGWIVHALAIVSPPHITHVDIVSESPEIVYTAGRGVRKQDIVDLARRAGEAVAVIAAACDLRMKTWNIEYVAPARWKGQVPKQIQQARTGHALGWEGTPVGSATGGYWAPKPSSVAHIYGTHDVRQVHWKHLMDAVGIYVWRVQEYGRRARIAAAAARAPRPESA